MCPLAKTKSCPKRFDDVQRDEVYDFCQVVGLPTTLADLGFGDLSEAELRLVAEKACAPGESIHNEPCAPSPAMVVDAMKAADVWGRQRKQLL